MKLKQVTKNGKLVRLNIGIKKSTDDLLSAYQQAYLKQYGQEIERSTLVEQILVDYIRADREFIASLEKKSEPQSQPQHKGASGAGSASGAGGQGSSDNNPAA